MGVQDLFKVEFVPPNTKTKTTIGDTGVSIKLNTLKRVALDVSHLIYRASLAMKQIAALTDSNGKSTVHINTIWNQIIAFKQENCDIIGIFDNPKANQAKLAENERRAKKRAEAAEAGKEKQAFGLTTEVVEDVKRLFNYMGVAWVEAPEGMEAEEYAAYLTVGTPTTRFCDYVLTGDSDVLLFGGNLLRPIKQNDPKTGKAKPVFLAYEYSTVLKNLKMNREEFVRMCVALGTDFMGRLSTCGQKTIVKRIKAKQIHFDVERLKVYENVLKDRKSEIVNAKVEQQKYNRKKAEKFLTSRNFSEERVKIRLDAYEKHIVVE